MHLTFWSIAAPVLFWGGLYFIPLPRALKIVIAIFVLAVGWSRDASAFEPPVGVGPVHSASVSGNVITFNPGTLTSANVSAGTFGHATNGAAFVESSASFRTAGGSVVPVVARSIPSAAAVAKTLVTGLAMASNVGVLLVAGVALYDFFKDQGYILDNSTGTLTVSKESLEYVCNVTWPPPTYGVVNAPIFAIAKQVCIPSGQPNIYTFGYSYSGGAMNYTGVTFPCGSSSCPTGTLWDSRGSTSRAVRAAPIPKTLQQLESELSTITSWPANSKIDNALRDAVNAGAPLALPKPVQITGPLEVAYPPKTVTNPDGTKTVTTTKEKITYGPDGSIKVDTETTVKTLDAAGNPTGTTVTTESPAAPKPDPITCGLPGTPACAIDETGTPKESPLTDAKVKQGTDDAAAAHKNLTDTIVGNADKNWSWTFLGAPPVAQCEAVQFPAVMGVTPPTMNPCGTVDGIRAIMSWIWAFVGFYMCIGYVREVI